MPDTAEFLENFTKKYAYFIPPLSTTRVQRVKLLGLGSTRFARGSQFTAEDRAGTRGLVRPVSRTARAWAEEGQNTSEGFWFAEDLFCDEHRAAGVGMEVGGNQPNNKKEIQGKIQGWKRERQSIRTWC